MAALSSSAPQQQQQQQSNQQSPSPPESPWPGLEDAVLALIEAARREDKYPFARLAGLHAATVIVQRCGVHTSVLASHASVSTSSATQSPYAAAVRAPAAFTATPRVSHLIGISGSAVEVLRWVAGPLTQAADARVARAAEALLAALPPCK